MEKDNKFLRTSAYFAAFIIVGAARGLIGPSLASLAAHTGTQVADLGYLISAVSLGNLISNIVAGRFYDRWPGHVLLLVSLLLIGVMLSLAPLLSMIWLLVFVLFVNGLCQGVIEVGGSTMTVWLHGRQSGSYLNGLYFFAGAGSIIAPILVGQAFARTGDIHWGYWLAVLVIIPAIILLLGKPSPTPPVVSEEEKNASIDMWLVGLVMLLLFVDIGLEVSMGTWLFTYATGMGLTDSLNGSYLNSGFFLALTLGRILCLPLVSRLSPLTIIYGDLIGALFFAAAIVIFPMSAAVLWVGAIGVGLMISSLFPMCIAFAERRMRLSGKVTGWFMMGGSLGSMTLAWISGQLSKVFGLRAIMGMILAEVVFGLLVLVLYTLREASQRRKQVAPSET